MGSACCVAAKDRTVASGSTSEILHRNVRHSPSWSFRWDNRVRVVGEETSLNWISDGISQNGRSNIKPGPTIETTYASEEGSPLDSFRSLVWQKSPVAEGNTGHMRLPAGGNYLYCFSHEFVGLSCMISLSQVVKRRFGNS